MIQIMKIANELDGLFKEHIESVEKHRVFVRLNFTIDIYIVSKDIAIYDDQYFATLVQDKYGEKCNSWKIIITVMSLTDMADDVYGHIFENQDVDEGSRHRLQTLIKGTKGKKLDKKVPVVTFYSYKGGMGRTTTLVSYAIHLAVQKKKRVFIIDCDLEAPGYLNFFDLSKHEPLTNGNVNGFVEYLCDIQFSETPESISLQDYMINISYGNQNSAYDGLQNIYLMPAGNLNDAKDEDAGTNRKGYIEGLSRINLADERVTRKNLALLFDKIKEEVNPDIILVDSRTGFNDIIGTATKYFADMVVGFFGSNTQNFPGLYTLLDNYLKSDYRLLLVNSIVSKPEAGHMANRLKQLMTKYLPSEQMEEARKAIPEIYQLTRLPILEKVGYSKAHEDYINLAKGSDFADYQVLFSNLDETLFQENIHSVSAKERNDTWTIRNRILQNLKQTLTSVTSFAELTEDIKEPLFFYRSCMDDFFDESKFIISGYKGTGKTYLYKALTNDSSISSKIRERANKIRHRANKPLLDLGCRLYCLDVISIGFGNKSFEFASIDYDTITNPSLYFKRIWQIYTWNAILLEDEFRSIREQSPLKDEILPITGDRSVMRYEKLIKRGIDVFVTIEDDMTKINDYLVQNNIKLFLMYDQLDTRIKPQYWDKAVSPLIDYWRDRWGAFSNILPKIFVRTDLFRRVMGTNTVLLTDNVINIEWSIDEIMAYFMKLVLYAHPEDFWEIMHRIDGTAGNKQRGRYAKKVESYKKQIQKNNNQMKVLDQSSLTPLVNTFFGSRVVSGVHDLGSPYDYFRYTLVNADRESISLRPFINTMDHNAIEQALAVLIPNRDVRSIISPDIYASRDVRIKAANSYFDDLARDEFSNDLTFLRKFLNSEKGIEYRKKTLSEEEFASMIDMVLDNYTLTQCQHPEDFITMLQANGIIDERFISGQKVWRFAPMYMYAWKLSSTKYDKDFSVKAKYED